MSNPLEILMGEGGMKTPKKTKKKKEMGDGCAEKMKYWEGSTKYNT